MMKSRKRYLALAMVVALMVAWAPLAMCQDPETVNINEATVEELMQLEKIGKKSAEKIVAFREQNGPFQEPRDIVKVKGVGSKTFEINRQRIVTE